MLLGLIASACMEAAKRWDAVPVNRGENTKIHILLAAVSTILAIAQAASNHQLSGLDWNSALAVLWPAVQIVGGALATYFLGIRKVVPG
jgi:hypothetical protein